MDLRPGGVFRITMVTDDRGAEFPSDMRFTRSTSRSTSSAFEWDGQRGIGGGPSTVTFKDLGDGRTEMTNHYAGYLNDTIQSYMTQGTNEQFDKLETLLKQ